MAHSYSHNCYSTPGWARLVVVSLTETMREGDFSFITRPVILSEISHSIPLFTAYTSASRLHQAGWPCLSCLVLSCLFACLSIRTPVTCRFATQIDTQSLKKPVAACWDLPSRNPDEETTRRVDLHFLVTAK